MAESNVRVVVDFIVRGLEKIRESTRSILEMARTSAVVSKISAPIKAVSDKFGLIGSGISKSSKSVKDMDVAVGSMYDSFGLTSEAFNEVRNNTIDLGKRLLILKTMYDKFGLAAVYTAKQMEVLNKLSQAGNISYGEVIRRLQKANLAVSESGELYEIYTGRQISLRNAMDRLRISMQRFRMELLSVMFFAWSIEGALHAMLKPAVDAYGIFDMWSTTMLVMFIPIMSVIAPLLYDLMLAFMNLPDGIKVVLGVITVLGLVVTTIMGLFAIWGLGIQGLQMAFGTFGVSIGLLSKIFSINFSAMGSKFTAFVTKLVHNPITWVITGIIAGVLLLNQAWKNNWFGIRQAFGNFLIFLSKGSGILSFVLKFIGSAVIVLANLFVAHLGIIYNIWSAVWNSVKFVGFSVWNALLSGVEFLVNGIISGFNLLLRSPIAKVIKDIFGIKDEIQIPKLDLSRFKLSVEDAKNSVFNAFNNIKNIVSNRISSTVSSLESWNNTIDNLSDRLISIGEASIKTGNEIDAGISKGTGFIEEGFKSAKSAISGVINEITGNFTATSDDAINSTMSLSDAFSSYLTPSLFANVQAMNLDATAVNNASNAISGSFVPSVYSASQSSKYLDSSIKGLTPSVYSNANAFTLDASAMNVAASNARNVQSVINTSLLPSVNNISSSVNSATAEWTKHRDIVVPATTKLNSQVSALMSTVNSYVEALRRIPTEITTTIKKYENVYRREYRWFGVGNVGFWMQHGGIVTKPTLIGAGEAGPEAIIPLNKIGKFAKSTYIINYSPNISISANMTNDIDVNRLISRIDDYVVGKLKSMVRL